MGLPLSTILSIHFSWDDAEPKNNGGQGLDCVHIYLSAPLRLEL